MPIYRPDMLREIRQKRSIHFEKRSTKETYGTKETYCTKETNWRSRQIRRASGLRKAFFLSACVITWHTAKYTSKETYMFQKFTFARDVPTSWTHLSSMRYVKGTFREHLCNHSVLCEIYVKRDLYIPESNVQKRPTDYRDIFVECEEFKRYFS